MFTEKYPAKKYPPREDFVPEKILSIKLNRVKAAMEKCPEAKAVLSELFPEALEPRFRSGSLFCVRERVAGHNQASHEIELKRGCSIDKYYLEELYILVHDRNSHEYCLVNLWNGYRFKRDEVYIRDAYGIKLTEHALRQLQLVSVGNGK
jgi:hypothetical protein